MTRSTATNGPAGRSGAGSTPLTVRTIDPAQHAAFAADHGASFLQVPAWARVKPDWTAHSIGWFDPSSPAPGRPDDGAGRLVGAALVLHRAIPLPGVQRSLAYLPEGPLLDWELVAQDPARWLDPLVAHARRERAFAVRIGPPRPVRAWSAATVKAGLADTGRRHFADLTADRRDAVAEQLEQGLRDNGWSPLGQGAGFSAGQPRFVVQLPLAGRSEADLLAGMNQQWRRNVKAADRAGVKVRAGERADLAAFHEVYRETAARDGFLPRPLAYFEGMWDAFAAGPQVTAGARMRLYLAELDGELAAAATVMQVGGHAWYSYGASTTRHRDTRASNAVQWQALREASARGCTLYDLRGITDTVDPGDPLSGLVRFKIGLGAEVVELLGEWERPVSRLWAKAFALYLARRP